MGTLSWKLPGIKILGSIYIGIVAIVSVFIVLNKLHAKSAFRHTQNLQQLFLFFHDCAHNAHIRNQSLNMGSGAHKMDSSRLA